MIHIRFALSCSLALVSSLAFADSIDSTYVAAQLTEIRVESVKTNKHNLTPASVSLVGPSLLRTQHLADVSELSGVLPNVFIPEYGSKQTTPIAIRGVMSKIKGSSVGFYIDGTPHFEMSSFDSDFLDIKAIEVYRGPQGTLYGRNTIGGVINVYTYSPFEYQGTKAKVGYGNYGNISAQFSHYARPSGRFGFSFGAYYKHKDGYFTNVLLDEKADKSNEVGGKLSFLFRPGTNLTLRLTSNLDYLSQGGYPYAPYDPSTSTLSPISYNRSCGFDRIIFTNGLSAYYNNGMFSINGQMTMQSLAEYMESDQDYSPADVYFTTLDFSQNALSYELTLKSESDSPLQYVSGLFYFHQVRDYISDTDYVQKSYHSFNDYTLPTTGFAAYAQLSYNIWSGLSATAGLRFDYERSFDNYQSYQVDSLEHKTVKSDFSSSLSTHDFMPKFGLQYKWNGRNVLFANVTRGCKAGSFNTVFQVDDERTYGDEYNWNYEVGIKAMSDDKRMSGELTAFFIDWRHQHVSRTIPGVGNVIYNAGHSQSKGVEASLAVRPLVGLFLQANYGYTYAKFLDYKKSNSQDYSGNMIPLVPRHTLSLHASYSISPRRYLDLLTFNLSSNGVGKLYWIEDNLVCQRFYTLLSAKISASKGPLTLDVWGKNITNTDYLAYYFTTSSKFAQNGLPATFGASLSLAL